MTDPVAQETLPEMAVSPGQVEVDGSSNRAGFLSRIQDRASDGFDGLREWVELRIELIRTEIESVVDSKVTEAKSMAMVGVFAGTAVFFLLMALAFLASFGFQAWIGWSLLPSLAAGFGLVMLIFFVLALIAYSRSPLNNSDS